MANAEAGSATYVRIDRTSLMVPVILGAGLLSVYVLPVARVGSEFGLGSIDIAYSDVRTVMEWAGYGWVNLIALLGIVAAAIASIVSLPKGSFPPRAIMIGGSSLGLVLPLFLLFTGTRYLGVDTDGGFGGGVSLGAGIVLYTLACIASLILSLRMGSDRSGSNGQGVWTQLSSSADLAVPVMIGFGVGAVLMLPPYDIHPMFMRPNPSFWDVIDIEREGIFANFTWLVLLGLGAAIVTLLTVARAFWTSYPNVHRILLRWGPIAALLLPIGFWLRWIGGFRLLDDAFDNSKHFFEHVGSGVIIFFLTCIIAAAVGWAATKNGSTVDSLPAPTT